MKLVKNFRSCIIIYPPLSTIIFLSPLFFLALFITSIIFFSGCNPQYFGATNPTIEATPSPKPTINDMEIRGEIEKVEFFSGSSTDWTVVRFKDGRVKAFRDITNVLFQEGKINLIKYQDQDCMDGKKRSIILSVKILDDKPEKE